MTLLILAASSIAAHAASPSKDLSVIYPSLTGPSRSIVASADKPLGGFEAAPMPNPNSFAPRPTEPAGPAVGPSLFRSNPTYRGDGFTPDSSPSIGQQSKKAPLPGISVKLPLY